MFEKSIFMVTKAWAAVYEDNYLTGEGKCVKKFASGSFIGEKAKTIDELIAIVSKYIPTVKSDVECWSITISDGKIELETDTLVDENYYVANDTDTQLWRENKKTLLSFRFYVDVAVVKEVIDPEDIKKVLKKSGWSRPIVIN